MQKSKGTHIIKPYILDLNSTNKTKLNNNIIDDSRYYELKIKDVINFGESTRDYVIMYDDSNIKNNHKKN